MDDLLPPGQSAGRYPLLMDRLVGQPLLVTPAKAQAVLGFLAARSGVTVTVNGAALSGVGLEPEASVKAGVSPARKLYALVDGVAILPVEGLLVARGGIDPYCGMTGYDGLTVKLAEALDDPDVRAILLDIDSCGGEAAGCFELADRLRAARAVKPLWAAVAPMAYSAAYALAASAERVWVPVVGGVGSVGVVTMHADQSAALAKAGIAVTLIHAGARKVDGNPYAALPDEVRERYQSVVEGIRDAFVARVAAGRGLSREAVAATEAECFTSAEALANGFATDAGDFDAALAALVAAVAEDAVSLGGPAATHAHKESTMTQRAMRPVKPAARKPKAEGTPPEDEEQDKPAEPEAEDPDPEDPGEDGEPVDPGPDDEEDKPAEGPAARRARAQERGRIRGIMTHPAAAGRPRLAQWAAFETGMTPQAFAAMAAHAAEEGGGPAPAASPTGWSQAMAQASPRVAAHGGAASASGGLKARLAAKYTSQ